MNKKIITLAFVLTLFAGLVLSFNPTGENPIKQSKTKATMTWEKAIQQEYSTTMKRELPSISLMQSQCDEPNFTLIDGREICVEFNWRE